MKLVKADLDRLSGRQYGLVTADQLNLSERQRRWRVERGLLILVRPRVYRLAGAPISWEQAVLAVALCAGTDAVVSHATAAAVWNLRHSDRHVPGIHLSGKRVRLKGVVCHQTRPSPAERTEFRRIPLTTVERTIIDLAEALPICQLGQCVDDAIRRRLLRLGDLHGLAAHLSRSGRLLEPVHQVLADRIPGYRPDDSDFETEMNRLWDRLGLPPARRQHRIVIDGHTYRLDRAIVECKIGTEWDSYRHHSDASDRDYDSNRRARLVGDGWLIVPVTANAEPELIARAVLRAYHDRLGGQAPKRQTA